MPNKVGVNLSRVLVAGRQNQADINLNTLRHGNPPQQFRVVVFDVFYDPNELTEQELRTLKDTVRNPEFVDNMPPNSILGKVVSSGEADTIDAPSIFYPYFQSHMMLPVVAGEHVHVIYEDYEREGSSLGRWVTRIHESRAVEDSNFTHADRRFDLTLEPAAQRTSEIADRRNGNSQPRPPGFPNGGDTNDSLTLPPSGSTGNPYDSIYQQSKASQLHQYEPVPRWTKRPDEFVLQGMNNSLIVLGQDRTGSAKRTTDSKDKKNYAGAVDIVVGRVRNPLNTGTVPDSQNTPTNALTVENTRRLVEVDKTPKLRNKTDNRREGDPDLKNDAARLMVLMHSEADTNLKTAHQTDGGITYPENTLQPTQPPAVSDRFNRAYVVAKGDHVRIVARKATIPSPGSGEVKGTILLVREGQKDQDLAYLYIDQNGEMQLESKKLYLGKSKQEQEPYIKWTEFKKVVDALQSQIDTLERTIKTMGTQLSSLAAASVCVPFLPDPAVQGIGSVVGTTARSFDLSADKRNTQQAVQNSKSNKIFGE